MGKGKQGAIALAGLQFLADRAAKQTNDRLIITSKGDNLALRDAEFLAALVNDELFDNFRKNVLKMKPNSKGKVELLKIGVFTQDNKFFTIDGQKDKKGQYKRTYYKKFADLKRDANASVIYGTPVGLMSLRINRAINKKSDAWFAIMDEVDSALVQTPPLIISGEKKKQKTRT